MDSKIPGTFHFIARGKNRWDRNKFNMYIFKRINPHYGYVIGLQAPVRKSRSIRHLSPPWHKMVVLVLLFYGINGNLPQ